MLAVGEKHPNMQSFVMSRKRFNSNSQKSGQEPIMTTIWKYSGSNQVDSSSSTLPPNSVSNLSTLIYIVRSSFNSSYIVLRKKHLKNLRICHPSYVVHPIVQHWSSITISSLVTRVQCQPSRRPNVHCFALQRKTVGEHRKN